MIVKALVRWLGPAMLLGLVGPLPANSTDAALHYRGCQPPPAGARTVTVNIRYRATPPTRVFAETASGADICFEHDEDAGQFVGQLPVAIRLTAYTIVAEMSPQRSIAISLEPPYRTRPLTLALPEIRDIPCRPETVRDVTNNARTRDAMIAAAHQARHWYLATSGCPASMKPVVAELWFSMSYQSLAREEALLLDRDAALAFLRVAPSRRGSIAGTIRNFEISQAGKRYHHQQALGASAVDALRVNLAIETAIRGNPLMARIYGAAGVFLPALGADTRRYQQDGRISSARLAELRTEVDPSIAIVPITDMNQLAAEAGR